MRLLLVRHGETVDNVAGVYAGVRDSALTTHGVLQAGRLASHLSKIRISYIYSSDLQRAFKTAESIRLAQSPTLSSTTQLELLREQDFGFYEGKSFLERQKGTNKSGKDAHRDINVNVQGFQDVESKESMKERADKFVELHLVEHLRTREEHETVVIVAHGIILSYLWRSILRKFNASKVAVLPGVQDRSGMALEYLGGWSNTGFLDLEVKKQIPAHGSPETEVLDKDSASSETSVCEIPLKPYDISSPRIALELPAATSASRSQLDSTTPTAKTNLHDIALVVKAVNSLEHLKGLKKTRGGIGSARHDDKQKTMDSFFKKKRLE